MSLKIFEIDGTLRGCEGQIWDRVNGYRWWKNELAEKEGGFEKFAEGYKIFGFNKTEGGYIYREWLPNAKQVFLIGEPRAERIKSLPLFCSLVLDLQ
ncbi:SBE2.1 [Symbiodinium necroappetens]|uniref:SBE2.1 protein n=1 Tax=Symbiodinium necroappetens TaxID=1628268 RepID=A0A813A882_9DINO|nr:SBE2.1 [Symbiodinium necroappetens]